MLTQSDLVVILVFVEETSAPCHFAEASFLSSHMTVRQWQWYPYNPLAVCLHCSFFSCFIRIWKRVTACPSQSIKHCHLHPPVLETSPHWTSPTMMIYPQTPATPQTRRKRVDVSRLSPCFLASLLTRLHLQQMEIKVCKARSYKCFCSYFNVYGRIIYLWGTTYEVFW